jgi:hypothetical protein
LIPSKLERQTFAFHKVKVTVEPAQLRTSVAKRLASGLSCLEVNPSSRFLQALRPYYLPPVYANHEVVPRLHGHLVIFVAQDLKAEGAMSCTCILRGAV